MERRASLSVRILASLAIAGGVAGALAVGAAGAQSQPGPGEPSLAEVRKATDKYRDVNVALKEGYIRDPMDICETADMMGRPISHGAMGVHYFRPDLLGVTAPPSPRIDGNGTHTDFLRPAVLIYEPQQNGSMELVAVENLVFIKSWKESGKSAPPTFHGVAYDLMTDDPATKFDEAHMFAPHFDRHVWIYRDNPAGTFAQFNAKVSCAHHKGTHKHPGQ